LKLKVPFDITLKLMYPNPGTEGGGLAGAMPPPTLIYKNKKFIRWEKIKILKNKKI
jgi:hypothetical protein